MVEMGKECDFPSNFDMLRLFTPPEKELSQKGSYSKSNRPTAFCFPEKR